jgi:class 3 adenylate cyclase
MYPARRFALTKLRGVLQNPRRHVKAAAWHRLGAKASRAQCTPSNRFWWHDDIPADRASFWSSTDSAVEPGELPFDLSYSDKTIAFVDVVESVRLIECDELRAVQRIRNLLASAETLVDTTFHGRVVERRGDGLLLEFTEPRAACECAIALHARALELNRGVEARDCVNLRIGVHRADVLSGATTVLGHGVNLASRIAALANVGETVVSAEVAGGLVNGVDGQLQDLGRCYVKHIDKPVRVYRFMSATEPTPAVSMVRPIDLKPRLAVMPFVPYRGAAGAVGIGDIVTDQLIGALSRSNTIGVISRLSTNALRGRRLSVDQIGTQLTSQFVVSGKYWTTGDALNVHVEVARAADRRRAVGADGIR